MDDNTSYFRFTSPLYSVLVVMISLLACSTRDAKFRQYYNQGRVLYEKNCSNCHQSNGSGLGLVYPPLDTSTYMREHFAETLCLLRHGVSGELVVNGKTFNQPMPGVSTLSDLEVAEIATYIYNTWSHKHGIVEVKEASQILANCPKE